MPPATYTGTCNSVKCSAQQRKKAEFTSDNFPTQQRKKPKASTKVFVRQSPRNNRKTTRKSRRKETPSLTYDRNQLLSLRESPLSKLKPDLPPIPGATVPRVKENKEIPLSLKLKLLKRGIVIEDTKKEDKPDPAIQKQTDVLKSLSLNEPEESWHDCDDAIWHSCVYNLI